MLRGTEERAPLLCNRSVANWPAPRARIRVRNALRLGKTSEGKLDPGRYEPSQSDFDARSIGRKGNTGRGEMQV